MLNELIIAIALILSIPVGYLIAWLCSDELVQGRIWFKIIILASILLLIWSYFIRNYPVLFTLVFIIVVSSISLIKSHDKKWTNRRI